MADGATDRTDKPDTDGDARERKPRRKMTVAERKAARRKRDQDRRERKKREEEAAAAAAVEPGELVRQADEARENATGAARTIVNAQLYREVFRQWTQGWSVDDLADKHNLSTRRVERIIADLRGSELTRLGVGDTLFSVKFAQRLVLQRSAAVSQYARAAEEIPDSDVTRAAVKLGYLKLRDQALDKFTQLVQELGWLPRNLGTLNTMMDALQMAEVMLEVMELRAIPEDDQRAIVEAIELRVVRRSSGQGLALAGVGPDLEGFATDMDGNGGEVHDGMGPGEGGDGPHGGGGDPGAPAPEKGQARAAA